MLYFAWLIFCEKIAMGFQVESTRLLVTESSAQIENPGQ